MCIKTFYVWLIRNHLHNDTPIGDLARDLKSDRREFIRATGYSRNRTYLTLRNAAPACIDAFDAAWMEYEAYKKEQRHA